MIRLVYALGEAWSYQQGNNIRTSSDPRLTYRVPGLLVQPAEAPREPPLHPAGGDYRAEVSGESVTCTLPPGDHPPRGGHPPLSRAVAVGSRLRPCLHHNWVTCSVHPETHCAPVRFNS